MRILRQNKKKRNEFIYWYNIIEIQSEIFKKFKTDSKTSEVVFIQFLMFEKSLQ